LAIRGLSSFLKTDTTIKYLSHSEKLVLNNRSIIVIGYVRGLLRYWAHNVSILFEFSSVPAEFLIFIELVV
jgi:hypothetical protein